MAGTCATESGGGGGVAGEIMLFGVRVVVDSMRKSVSLNNLSQYEQPQDFNATDNNKKKQQAEQINNNNNSSKKDKDDMAASGYASADDAVPHSSNTRGERKRGVPWTEEEHKLFLLGLQKVGKGDWRGISRNFVKTRTPTQVASHAQKYFLRRSNLNRRRRRSSLFDITTDTVMAFPMEEEQAHNHQDDDNNNNNSSETTNFPVISMPMPAFSMTPTPAVIIESPMENLSLLQPNHPAATTLIRPVAVIPALPTTSGISDLNLNTDYSSTLSLKLSLPSDQRESPSTTARHSAFQVMSGFNNGGDGIITVA